MHPNIREYSKNAYASTKELTLSKRSSGATCDLINMLATNKKQSNQSNVIRNMSICVSFWHALLGSLNYTYDSLRTGCDTRTRFLKDSNISSTEVGMAGVEAGMGALSAVPVASLM